MPERLHCERNHPTLLESCATTVCAIKFGENKVGSAGQCAVSSHRLV